MRVVRISNLNPATAWPLAQFLVWGVGATILTLLVFAPKIGIHAFWNVLIPIAPALLAILPGMWRNICPLAITGLLPRHLGLSRRLKLSVVWQGRFSLIGVALLLLIVPLRHVVLDLDGHATAMVIGLLAIAAISAGFFLEWKSGWCSGLCPVHPVEKLYGSEPLASVPNMHCTSCERCVGVCPDSTPGMHSLTANKYSARTLAGILIAGGFAGYIWGWFQVRDYAGGEGWRHLGQAYGWPFAGMVVTLTLFIALRAALSKERELVLIRIAAAAAICCYYWYRLPALFGFGPFPGDGMLVDLRDVLPVWFPVASQAVTTAFFMWWLVGRRSGRESWGRRPAFSLAPDHQSDAISPPAPAPGSSR